MFSLDRSLESSPEDMVLIVTGSNAGETHLAPEAQETVLTAGCERLTAWRCVLEGCNWL